METAASFGSPFCFWRGDWAEHRAGRRATDRHIGNNPAILAYQ
jgi:hypothetical protein